MPTTTTSRTRVPLMRRFVRCTCGALFWAEDEEELYTLVRHHLQGPDPESHHPVPNPASGHLILVECEGEPERDHRDAVELALGRQRE